MQVLQKDSYREHLLLKLYVVRLLNITFKSLQGLFLRFDNIDVNTCKTSFSSSVQSLNKL